MKYISNLREKEYFEINLVKFYEDLLILYSQIIQLNLYIHHLGNALKKHI